MDFNCIINSYVLKSGKFKFKCVPTRQIQVCKYNYKNAWLKMIYYKFYRTKDVRHIILIDTIFYTITNSMLRIIIYTVIFMFSIIVYDILYTRVYYNKPSWTNYTNFFFSQRKFTIKCLNWSLFFTAIIWTI